MVEKVIMESRQIVKKCIEFDNPPRIAWNFQVDPIEGKLWRETDFACVCHNPHPDFQRKPGEMEWVTEWGVRWATLTTQLGEAVGNPLADGWHLLDSYRFPDFEEAWRWEGFQERVDRFRGQGKYVYAPILALMLLPTELRGMQNWFMDNMAEPENLGRLMDRIVETCKGLMTRYADAGVEGVITWDDMGVQDRVHVSPAVFRELYLPRYKELVDFAHEKNMHYIHHCCGQVRDYMDMFVEAGLDVLQLDQPRLMGIDWLSENYGGKMCFWNCVDIQATIGKKDNLDAIEREAHKQVWKLGNFGGGFMVKAYQQPESIDMTIPEAQRQYEAFKRYGNYPLIPYEE